MRVEYVILICLVGVFVVFLFPLTHCGYHMAFYNGSRKKRNKNKQAIHRGKLYDQHEQKLNEWHDLYVNLPYTSLQVKAFDGLTLRGRYYEFNKGAITEILFHGYRGSAERDMAGGIARCKRLGRNALLVDQRGCGDSDGKTITFGVKERKDAVVWANKAVELLGSDCKLILTGISMGASTVILASELSLPKNVIGIIADCGYSSTKEMMLKVLGEMKLSKKFIYPFLKLSARVFGRFNLEERAPIDAVKNATVPIIFLHGDKDDFVPYYMSEENFSECKSDKKLVKIAGAGHGVSYLMAPEYYEEQVKEFERVMSEKASK